MKEIKISKLFHLLYATLLLAPVFAVGVSCVQTAFTGNGLTAQDNVIYNETATISANDTSFDIWYNLDIGQVVGQDWGTSVFYNCDLFLIEGDGEQPIYMQDIYSLLITYRNGSMVVEIETSLPVFTVILSLSNIYKFAFQYSSPVEVVKPTTLKLSGDISYLRDNLPVMVADKGYQDIFYTSIDKVGASPFFNWAEKSFLGDGFRYMGNIFGMPTDNPFYTFTCYWCAISILWLIFDVVMYVPKLAHRWLDKGAIE